MKVKKIEFGDRDLKRYLATRAFQMKQEREKNQVKQTHCYQIDLPSIHKEFCDNLGIGEINRQGPVY